MKRQILYFLIIILFVGACSGQKDADREYKVPSPAEPAGVTMQSNSAIPEKPPIDPGDVDSGVTIVGKLAAESEAENITEEYLETKRDTLSLATITVREPFPEKIIVEFRVLAMREYAERPVIVRARAYREETPFDSEYGFVLGKEATSANSSETRRFTVNVLEGFTEIPDTLLIHARADAWLMPLGTDETSLNPMTDSAPDRVSLLSNPVRINFVKEGLAQ